MATLRARDVIIVPPAKRSVLVSQRDDVFIQSPDEDEFCRPDQTEESLMTDFVKDNYHGAPKRFWVPRVGTRVGYNGQGIFIHENHQKRYFGLDSSKASVAVMQGIDQPVPMVNAKGERTTGTNKTDQILGKMLHHLPSLTNDMRYRVLSACFQRADRNGNGKLSRPELGIVLRKVVNNLSSSQVSEMIREADEDSDGQISYKEFVKWLQESANPKFSNAFGSSLKNEADIVRATFRMWDNNGDGMIPDKMLFKALAKVHPDMKETQVRALVKCMDSDKDGNVDYDEFVDFLFHRAERS